MTGVTIRETVKEDENFILNSWLHSYRESQFASQISRSIYFTFHEQLLKALLKRETIKKLVAVSQDEKDLIYGYAIYEVMGDYKIFHYIYVKRPFSGFGIAKELLKNAPFPLQKGVYASHLTYKGKKLVEDNHLTYCPYLL